MVQRMDGSLSGPGRVLGVLGLMVVLGASGSLHAQGFDPAKQPVTTVPGNRWGALQPASILGDSSWWNFGSTPTSSNPFWHDVDVENGFVFTTTGRGLMTYDAVGDPVHPTRKSYFFAGTSTVPSWHQNDTKFYLFGVDAPAGNDGVVAVACISGNGMLIFDTRNKQFPRLMYQDDSKEGSQVWATTYGGTAYAFYAATNNRVLIYNLSAAQNLAATGCLDNSPSSVPCKDPQNNRVYVGKINTQSGASYVHGAGDYLAVSQGSLGVEIWKVSDPVSPQRVVLFRPPGNSAGVALWQDGTKYYLAVVQISNTSPHNLNVYDASCITGGGTCTPSLVSTFQATYTVPSTLLFATFSRRAGTPYLYLGGEDMFSGGDQREYLLDMTDPTAPVDVTPHAQAGAYWGWYYYGNPTGFNWVMPRTAKFHGNYLYRAAYGLFDVHEFKGNTPPTASFSAGTQSPDGVLYSGDPITFTDTSTGFPTSWSWTFLPDGSLP